MDEKIKAARITVREERMSYDVKKAEVEQAMNALKVTRCYHSGIITHK